ncbi:hypothetical protein [Chryseobacterium arthrosphaerae]|uniref:hypothetical protein n=1 Tax=Chryseobacterium arthrosphaerae TaxID=651561 RepID=UPI001F4A1B63|nr:hypothetical protein [Chryseobacterium arthrosphaerae]
MRFNLHSYYETIPFNYVNEIFRTIYRDIIVASEKDHLNSFNELLNFLVHNLKGKSFNSSTNAFSKSVTLFIYIYPNLSSQYKKIFIERVFGSLITTISISKDVENVDEKYVELSYLSLINIFKLILQNDDYELFNIAVKEFTDTIFHIENRGDRGNFFFYFVTTLLSWIYFLKKNKSITYEKYDINYLENSLENMSYNFDFIFINYFFELFDKIENQGLWAVSEWEIKEPPKNQAYFALSPHNWLPYSLTIMLLKFEHLISLNIDLSKIKLNPRFRFMHDNIKEILDNINLENEEYKNLIFNNITNQDQSAELNFKKEKILNVFSFLKKEMEIDYYKKIREIPLSKEKIEEFRANVGKLWEENTIVLNILKSLGNVDYVPNIEEVKGYGFFQRLLKMKFAFIEGELHQNIFGLSDFGSHLARSIDNDFFNKFKNDKIIPTNNIKETVWEFIDKTKNKSSIVIFANWRNADKLEDITYEHNSENPIFNKKFKGIPVVHQFSKFKDSILVIDFSLIKASIYTNDSPNWYKNQLLIEITESQKDDITDDVIKEWNEKDGYNYDENEVDILESNNVNAKILLKYEFIIPEETRYLIIKP